jgi:membrane protease YdiL (CAAX protease family)
MLPDVLLLLITVYMAAILWRGRTFRIGLAASRRRGRRAALYGWAMGVAISFGLPAAFGVMLLGPPLAWEAVPPAFQPLVLRLEANGRLVTPEPLLIGMVGGTFANILVSLWQARRGRAHFRIGRFPDVTPASRGDFLPAILLSVSAGISEELFFRLFVPLLVALVSGSALLGCVVATLLFGALHRYQGAGGVIATTLVGAVLAYVYLASGALWLAMLFHIVIDLNALVVRSAIAGAWRVSSSSASRS